MSNCGPGGGGTESCCTSLPVTGGTYNRTYTNTGSGATGQADPANVSSFRLDKYLVTVGRFRQFVNAWNGGAGWLPTQGSGKHTHLNGGLGLANSGSPGNYEPGWNTSNNANIAPTNSHLACENFATWTNTAGTPPTWSVTSSPENLPIDCVDWWEAYAFCTWDGGFLPSEAEWEYAAAGGSLQREYPWGSTDPGMANQYAIYGGWDPQVIDLVGTAPAGGGLWGQLDLAGEVWEWVLDWYASAYGNPCTDGADLTPGSTGLVRGGDYGLNTSYFSPHREVPGSLSTGTNNGLRCARAP